MHAHALLPLFPPSPVCVDAWCSYVQCKPREEVVQARASPDPPPHWDLFWVFVSRTFYYMAVSVLIYIL